MMHHADTPFYLHLLESIITTLFNTHPEYDKISLTEVFRYVPPQLVNINTFMEGIYLVEDFGEGAITKKLGPTVGHVKMDFSEFDTHIIIRDKWEKRHGLKH
jgi:hypothetical protein